MNFENHENSTHKRTLEAIKTAIQEEKAPFIIRLIKIALCTVSLSAVIWLPFLFHFKVQMNWIWIIAFALWTLCIGFGFSLYFYPQPRLIISGLWTPMIFARLLIVAAILTMVEILICPSFVFLDSPVFWNPLESITESLMNRGGMELCMSFCGFLFSFLSGGIGAASTWKVMKRSKLRSMPAVFAVLLISQLPVLAIQFCSPELRPFLPNWIMGLVVGTLLSVGIVFSLGRSKSI